MLFYVSVVFLFSTFSSFLFLSFLPSFSLSSFLIIPSETIKTWIFYFKKKIKIKRKTTINTKTSHSHLTAMLFFTPSASEDPDAADANPRRGDAHTRAHDLPSARDALRRGNFVAIVYFVVCFLFFRPSFRRSASLIFFSRY